MANDLGHNPWKIDTASSTALTSSYVKINKILWDQPTTAGHQAIITNKDGDAVWSMYAIAGGNGIYYREELNDYMAKGLIVPTLGSGTLYIYIR